MIQDYLLIEKMKKGDTEAWDILVHKYYDQIYLYCVRRCYGDRVLAADLTQDIFMKLISNIQNYHYTGKFYNYLYTIAINTCNNYYTKKKFVQLKFDDSVIATAEESIIDIIVMNENNTLIQKALDRLPDIQREVLILKYYHDLKVKDIAKATGVSVSTAQSRINQGLKKLSKMLDREDFKNG